jgi:hypothetical protein
VGSSRRRRLSLALVGAVTLAATAAYAQRIWVGGPRSGFWRGGPPPFAVRADFDGTFNYCRTGIQDARRRLMVVMTHNTDIADTWEREGENREYFERFSPDGYAIGVNFILYAMTH